MPELPEVETMVRGIREPILGKRLVSFSRARCRRKPVLIEPSPRRLARRIKGQRVSDVRRFAKRIVIELSGGGLFAIEPRMTGLLLLADAPTHDHLRAVWRLADPQKECSPALWYWDRRGLGTIRYYQPGRFDTEVAERLGPDALAMTTAKWRSALAQTARPVKVALLDQSLVAGIGNLYANEILFHAGVHPAREARGLSSAEVNQLGRSCGCVLEEAIRCEGSTLADGTYRNALNQNGGYQSRHQVYGRQGRPCARCGEPIVRRVQSGRSTFFCPVCQREEGV